MHVLQAAKLQDARNKGGIHFLSCTSFVPLPSRTFSHTCGHCHVSLNGLRKRKTARSLAGKCKTEQRDLLHLQSLHSQEHNTSCLEDTQKYKFNNIKANVQRDIFY